MKRWKVTIDLSNELRPSIALPFHEERYAQECVDELRAHMAHGGGLYGIAGVATIDTKEVTAISITDYDDGEDEQNS